MEGARREIGRLEKNFNDGLHQLIDSIVFPCLQLESGLRRWMLSSAPFRMAMTLLFEIFEESKALCSLCTICDESPFSIQKLLRAIIVQLDATREYASVYVDAVVFLRSRDKGRNEFFSSLPTSARSQDPEGFLIRPLTHCPKYEDYLQIMMAALAEGCDDAIEAEDLSPLLESIKTRIDSLNGAVRQAELRYSLLTIEQKFSGALKIYTPGRVFIRSGALERVRFKSDSFDTKPVLAHLFNNLLVCSTEGPTTGSLKVYKVVDLDQARLIDTSKLGINNLFGLEVDGAKLMFRCQDEMDVAGWKQDVSQALVNKHLPLRYSPSFHEQASFALPDITWTMHGLGLRGKLITSFIVEEAQQFQDWLHFERIIARPLLDVAQGSHLVLYRADADCEYKIPHVEATGRGSGSGPSSESVSSLHNSLGAIYLLEKSKLGPVVEALNASDLRLFLHSFAIIRSAWSELLTAIVKVCRETGCSESAACGTTFVPLMTRAFMRNLNSYIHGRDALLQLLARPVLSVFVKQALDSLCLLQRNVSEVLHLPVTLNDRCRAFLAGLQNITPSNHADADCIRSALASLDGLSVSIDVLAEERRNVDKLLVIQKSLFTLPLFKSMDAQVIDSLVSNRRKFLKEADMYKVCRKRNKYFRFWLFSDCIIYASPLGNGQFHFHRKLNLLACVAVLPNSSILLPNAFDVQGQEKSFTVVASSMAERDEWLAAIRSATAAATQAQDASTVAADGSSSIKIAVVASASTPASTPVAPLSPLWSDKPLVGKAGCLNCGKPFGIFRNKYICGDCGGAVCHDHSSLRSVSSSNGATTAKQRVCNGCFSLQLHTLPVEASLVVSAEAQPVATFAGSKQKTVKEEKNYVVSFFDTDKCLDTATDTLNILHFSDIHPQLTVEAGEIRPSSSPLRLAEGPVKSEQPSMAPFKVVPVRRSILTPSFAETTSTLTVAAVPLVVSTDSSALPTPASVPVTDPPLAAYEKMRKIGIAEGAIRHKMIGDGIKPQDIDAFFGKAQAETAVVAAAAATCKEAKPSTGSCTRECSTASVPLMQTTTIIEKPLSAPSQRAPSAQGQGLVGVSVGYHQQPPPSSDPIDKARRNASSASASKPAGPSTPLIGGKISSVSAAADPRRREVGLVTAASPSKQLASRTHPRPQTGAAVTVSEATAVPVNEGPSVHDVPSMGDCTDELQMPPRAPLKSPIESDPSASLEGKHVERTVSSWSKYDKMKAMNIPEEAIRMRMKLERIPEHEITAYFTTNNSVSRDQTGGGANLLVDESSSCSAATAPLTPQKMTVSQMTSAQAPDSLTAAPPLNDVALNGSMETGDAVLGKVLSSMGLAVSLHPSASSMSSNSSCTSGSTSTCSRSDESSEIRETGPAMTSSFSSSSTSSSSTSSTTTKTTITYTSYILVPVDDSINGEICDQALRKPAIGASTGTPTRVQQEPPFPGTGNEPILVHPPSPVEVEEGDSSVGKAAADKYTVYKKMLSAGVPEGAVRRKMELSGISASEIDSFLGVAVHGPTSAASVPGVPSPAASQRHMQPIVKETEVPRVPLKEAASCLSQAEMLNQIRGGIQLKQTKRGTDSSRDDKGPGTGNEPILMPPPLPVKAAEEDSRVGKAAADKYTVYKKMLSAGVPEGAVRRKMELSGISASEMDSFFGMVVHGSASAAPVSELPVSAASQQHHMQPIVKETEVPQVPLKEAASSLSQAEMLNQIRGGIQLKQTKRGTDSSRDDKDGSTSPAHTNGRQFIGDINSNKTIVATTKPSSAHLPKLESNQCLPKPAAAAASKDLLNSIRTGVQLRRANLAGAPHDSKHQSINGDAIQPQSPPPSGQGNNPMMRVLADALNSRRQKLRRDDSICSVSSHQW